MAIVEAIVVHVRVACALMRTSLDDVILAVVQRERCPKLLNCDVGVVNAEARGSIKSSGCFDRRSSSNMRIVTVVLGKGLFKDGHPHGAVGGNLAEHSVSPHDGKPFINNDSVGSTKSEKVNGVDSSFVQLLLFVQENFLDTAWFLSKG